MNYISQRTRQSRIGLFILLGSVLAGSSGQALANPNIKVYISVSFRVSGSVLSRCIPPNLLQSELIEGTDEGFEYEFDEEVPNQEVLVAIDIAHQLMRGELNGSSIGFYPAASIKNEVLKAFETHIEDYPEDWYSQREYAYALMWDKQFDKGIEVLLACYEADPTLVRIAFDEDIFGVGTRDLGIVSQNLVRYARREGSAGGWFAMSVILQGKGNYTHALTSLEHATALGFDQELALSMETSLRASIGE